MAKPRGKWEHYDFTYDIWYCSECGRPTSGAPEVCPYCGIKMEPAGDPIDEMSIKFEKMIKKMRRKTYISDLLKFWLFLIGVVLAVLIPTGIMVLCGIKDGTTITLILLGIIFFIYVPIMIYMVNRWMP